MADIKPAPAAKPKTKQVEAEEKTLAFWKDREIFRKTLDKPSPKGDFIFFEGPPTANGRPGIHHIEARAFKDAIPRYKTMRGFHVRRKGGWDTHGLPVELEVEKAHGFTSKKDIEAYGVAKFNAECKTNVWRYIDEWGTFTERIGYWLDETEPYVTYKNSYMESLWWIMAQIDKKGLIYKDYRVVPWCPRCGTALSSHELAQGYADVKEISIYVSFKIVGTENEYLLAWTTTPWTLPGNVALAVGADMEYARVASEGKIYVLALDRVASVFAGKEHSIEGTMKGSSLVGTAYEPLYDFIEGNDRAFKVYAADFVTAEDGTGIVHIAPMYGADDFALGTKVGLPKKHVVSDAGTFLESTGALAGKFVKDEATAVEILKELALRGQLFKKEKHEHSYPHCWRCKTPLIYFARDSWYIRMSAVRDRLVSENEKINWEPAHIKEGRFGEWIRDVKDWAISRERYWGTPLPIWQTADGKERLVVDSIETLKDRSKPSRNRYMLLRHGESEANVLGISNFEELDRYHLTEKGRAEIKERAKELSRWGVDAIVGSDFLRTKETARIIAEAIGLDKRSIVYDKRLREFRVGEGREGKPWRESEKLVREGRSIPGMESAADIKKRAFEVVAKLEKEYEGKNILIVSHGAVLNTIASGIEGEPSVGHLFHDSRRFFQMPGEMRPFEYKSLPHDADFQLDLHKPYIDDVVLISDSGREMRRVKEVIDVWFDSGAMPFAQDHYPFSPKFKGFFGKRKLAYPADYISEAIDQTRGWFYTLHAVGTLLGKGRAYDNVICLGHILDKDGKKMSKSLGNAIDPWTMIDAYGADAIRFWMYSVNQPGDSKNFDEKTVDEIVKRVFNMIANVHTFYEIYASADRGASLDVSASAAARSTNVLDRWIVARTNELAALVTTKLDAYKLLEPTRAIRDFVDDLSAWYIRRSRDRFKSSDEVDKEAALHATRHVLGTLAKLMAPFTPFFAEDIYRKIRGERDPESVHLCDWPAAASADPAVIRDMAETRRIVTLALQERAKANIKVRQPLAKLSIKADLGPEYIELVRDEVNVKSVVVDPSLASDTLLDVVVTDDLRREGVVRDLIRAIQDLRKKEDLSVGDKVALSLDSDEKGKELVRAFIHDIKRVTLVTDVEHAHLPQAEEIAIEEFRFKIGLRR